MKNSIWRCIGSLFFALPVLSAMAADNATFNVRDRGAKGDGKALDTAAINQAIEACSAAGGGQVLFPAGKYLTGTVQLKSNVTLMLDAGSEIIGTTELDQYRNFAPPADTPLADRLRWHRALILGEGVENVTITGRGVIDGNKVSDPRGEEGMRGPHAVLFGNSQHVTIRDVSIRDAGNYAVMLELTSHVELRGVKITGGWDGVHFRGWKDDPCRDVHITDCELYTGDDCIAGWYWEDTLIDHCVINSSCNGIRLIGPANKLIIHDCLFFGPGRYEHRTSREKHRTNMLAALCLQPGAWGSTEGSVDGVHISDVVAHYVATPLHLAAAKRNIVGNVTIDRLSATGAYRAAASIESWGDEPVKHVSLRDVSMTFVPGSREAQDTKTANKPGVDARPLPAWGLYARNVNALELDNVHLRLDGDDRRPAVIAEGVHRLDLDRLQFPSGLHEPLVFKDVAEVRSSSVAKPIATPKCIGLKPGNDACSVEATFEKGEPGLARIEMTIDGNSLTRWVWLTSGQEAVLLDGLTDLRGAGKHQIQCGDVSIYYDGAHAAE
jgi:hypothetical protein